jgi:hypothetical protein
MGIIRNNETASAVEKTCIPKTRSRRPQQF